jgi:hypothetical protein
MAAGPAPAGAPHAHLSMLPATLGIQFEQADGLVRFWQSAKRFDPRSTTCRHSNLCYRPLAFFSPFSIFPPLMGADRAPAATGAVDREGFATARQGMMRSQ